MSAAGELKLQVPLLGGTAIITAVNTAEGVLAVRGLGSVCLMSVGGLGIAVVGPPFTKVVAAKQTTVDRVKTGVPTVKTAERVT